MTKKNRGFTLLETFIIVTITLILVVIVLLPFRQFDQNQALSKETSNLVGIINQVRSETLSSLNSEEHGIHLASTTVTMFGGTTYSASDPNNISIPLNSKVIISATSLSGGKTDIYFNRLIGTASATGTITLSLVASSTQTKTITINSTGIIDSNQ